MAEQEIKKMLVKASEDVYVALTTGDAVRLEAGETREFPDYIAYACIQAGCTEVKEAPKKIEELIEETKEKPKKTTKSKKVEE